MAPGSPASRINEASRRAERHRPTGGGVELAPIVDLLPVDHLGSATMAPPVGPEHAAARAEIRRVLEQAVDTLPTPFRVVFMMRVVEQLSIEETAAALAVPAATVKTRLHRANETTPCRPRRHFRRHPGGYIPVRRDALCTADRCCADETATRRTDRAPARLKLPAYNPKGCRSCYAAPLAAAAMLCLAGLPVEAAPPDHAPPPAPFRKVSELVKLPDFLPGMGTL